jgi:hypothetical protein
MSKENMFTMNDGDCALIITKDLKITAVLPTHKDGDELSEAEVLMHSAIAMVSDSDDDRLRMLQEEFINRVVDMINNGDKNEEIDSECTRTKKSV